MKEIFLLLLVCGFHVSIRAQAQFQVTVSSSYSAIAYSSRVVLRPNENETFELPTAPFEDKYVVVASVRGGSLNLITFDKINVERQEPNPVLLLNKVVLRSVTLTIPRTTSGQGVVGSFTNDSEEKSTLEYFVLRLGTRPLKVRRQLQELIEIPLLALSKFYRLPRFTVTVKPCGMVNAYSSPDITICSELLADLYEKDMVNALYPILYHELSHTLLRLWGLPGYDNEDIADEFAATMLARVFPKYIETVSRYLESKDLNLEVLAQLTERTKHSLSMDRARNMRNAMQNIAELEARWDKLLKPFELKSKVAPSSKWELLGRNEGVPTYYQQSTFEGAIISIWLRKGSEFSQFHVKVNCSNHQMRYIAVFQGSKQLRAVTKWGTPRAQYGEWVYSEICSKFAM